MMLQCIVYSLLIMNRIANIKIMEVIFYAPPNHHHYSIQTIYENQIFKTVVFNIEDHKYLRLRKLNPFQLCIQNTKNYEEYILIYLHPFSEEHVPEKQMHWTKLEVKNLLKLKLEQKKYFSFPVYHQTKLTGEIKIKIEALSKEEEFITENSKYLQKCISRTTVSTHFKPILSRKEIQVTKANIQFPRKSMEMQANIEENDELFKKFEMINQIYKEKQKGQDHQKSVWEQPKEQRLISFGVIDEERQSQISSHTEND